MTTWHVLLGDGNVSGPYSECQIRNGIEEGKIADPMRVRQGQSPWIRVSKVKALFESLDDRGFFIRDAQQKIYGPFTEARIQAMSRSNGLPLVYWLRKGKHGPWECVDRQPTPEVDEPTQTISESVPLQPAPSIVVTADSFPIEESATMSTTSRSETLEVDQVSVKALVPAAPVMKLRTHSWKNAIMGISERFENLILGDPLTN